METIILSLKPNWWNKILSGAKSLEIRKNAPRCSRPFRCLVYETAPGRQKIVGKFIVNKVHQILQISKTETAFMKRSCLSAADLLQYANGKPIYAWEAKKAAEFKAPIALSVVGLKRPPQSWCYLPDGVEYVP